MLNKIAPVYLRTLWNIALTRLTNWTHLIISPVRQSSKISPLTASRRLQCFLTIEPSLLVSARHIRQFRSGGRLAPNLQSLLRSVAMKHRSTNQPRCMNALQGKIRENRRVQPSELPITQSIILVNVTLSTLQCNFSQVTLTFGSVRLYIRLVNRVFHLCLAYR